MKQRCAFLILAMSLDPHLFLLEPPPTYSGSEGPSAAGWGSLFSFFRSGCQPHCPILVSLFLSGSFPLPFSFGTSGAPFPSVDRSRVNWASCASERKASGQVGKVFGQALRASVGKFLGQAPRASFLGSVRHTVLVVLFCIHSPSEFLAHVLAAALSRE